MTHHFHFYLASDKKVVAVVWTACLIHKLVPTPRTNSNGALLQINCSVQMSLRLQTFFLLFRTNLKLEKKSKMLLNESNIFCLENIYKKSHKCSGSPAHILIEKKMNSKCKSLDLTSVFKWDCNGVRRNELYLHHNFQIYGVDKKVTSFPGPENSKASHAI